MSSHYSTVKNSQMGDKTVVSYSEAEMKSGKNSTLDNADEEDILESIITESPNLEKNGLKLPKLVELLANFNNCKEYLNETLMLVLVTESLEDWLASTET